MDKNIKFYLEHILESILLLEEYTKGYSREDFLNSIKLQDLVCRRLEIIGEAVKNLPESFKNIHTDVEWRKIAGMRNYLIHEYFGIDYKLTWNVIQKNLPELKEKINNIMKKQNI
ncbi:MAG: DUF86 domain-containing protein [Candidatus Muiribacteriota bacterium]|jgi:uncharacterized protein with HEPN domain